MSDVPSGNRLDDLRENLRRHGQEHVLTWWSELSEDQREDLIRDLETVDVEGMVETFKRTCVTPDKGRDMSTMIPLEQEVTESVVSSSPSQLTSYLDTGLRAAAAGQVGVLCLAGGMGTRLGVPYPKGMFDVGLPSGKTLYQIQVERILRLQDLAKRLTGQDSCIPLYIMTSEHTRDPTLEFFKTNNFFGLREDQVIIFEQRTIPAFTMEGKFVMETKSSLARSPDGNGGLYWALREEGVLKELEQRDVRYLHAFCVDNILVKVADPVFMGYCISKGADAGNKVVEKNSPTEGVGVICRVEGKIQVVEYSEISKERSEMRDKDGRLTYRAGNICNHFFTRDFLQRVCQQHESDLPQHIAKKKIPFTDPQTGKACKPESPNGIKLEKFVFDVFEFSESFVLWECEREEEFSPLKVADSPGAANTPTTAREALFHQHRRFLVSAGASVSGESGEVEVSPLASYGGEGLERYSGQSLASPVEIRGEGEGKVANGIH